MVFNCLNLSGEIWTDIVALPSFRRTYSRHFCSGILRLHCNNQVENHNLGCDKNINKLASLEATLVRNYDPLNHLITDRGKV